MYTTPTVLVPSQATLFKKLSDVLAQIDPSEHYNLYYTVAHHAGIEGAQFPQRSVSTFELQTVLAFDIDQADTARAFEYCAVIADILESATENFTLVNSGNGVHVICHLKHPIRSAKYFKENKPAYNEVCERISKRLIAGNLPGKVDPTIFEPARILRLPSTINRKPKIGDKQAILLQYSDVQLDINLSSVSGLEALSKQNVLPQDIRRNYPSPDFGEMVKECRFIRWCIDKPDEVHEPHVFDLFSLLVCQSPSAKIEINNEPKCAVDVANHVFTSASSSRSLSRQVFDDKWEAAKKYGARRCETISDKYEGCKTCPHYGKIPTPLALKSQTHISTKDSGFWIYNSKGQPSVPHYGDLTKIYSDEVSYVTTKEGRILTFCGSHYMEAQPIHVKAWVEKKLTPTDPVREAHRVEFLQKIRAQGALTEQAEQELFVQSIQGKLNCRNGVLDIAKGAFIDPSPKIGFRYTLPYSYESGDISELFMDWLDEITLHRTELMECLLDLMAYCLWPGYEDHMFTFLVGEGANGKSTFMHIIAEMLGKNNVSSASIYQLCNNRFGPVELEGKLVNLSEESSGYEITFEAGNVLKLLSSGETLMVERKGQQGYTMRNTAKLIFSANRPPKFREGSHAIKRRLVVVPFDYHIAKPDPSVEEKLVEDIPAILSMLVERIQGNIALNKGKFRVGRGGQTTEEAQKKMLTHGDTAIQWADEHLERTTHFDKDAFVTVSECFAKYIQWCDENAVKNVKTKFDFSRAIWLGVVPEWADKTKSQRRVGERNCRIFPNIRFRVGVAE